MSILYRVVPKVNSPLYNVTTVYGKTLGKNLVLSVAKNMAKKLNAIAKKTK